MYLCTHLNTCHVMCTLTTWRSELEFYDMTLSGFQLEIVVKGGKSELRVIEGGKINMWSL